MGANGGKLEVVDINKKKSEIEVKELKSLSQAVEGLKEKYPGLVHWRIPVCNSAAPKESDFDIISPGPPLAASSPASSKSSRSPPPMKVL